jgi:hypothetical protein
MDQSFTDEQGERFDPERFAELIVRECSVALNPMLRDQISRGHAADLIKKHFGVDRAR